jgi:thiol-disulfide isomerase/thioredoxin
MPASKSKRSKQKNPRTPQILVIGGVVLLVLMVLIYKQSQSSSRESLASAGELPAEQLERAMRAGLPTLAFFHSNNCDQCIEMTRIVEQVYPEFAESVVLVDVNVYDEQNQSLLRRASIRYIPTLIFFDQNGQGTASVGVTQPDLLRDQLAALTGEK